MGARTLEARLTARIVGLAALVLAGVGVAAVVVTDRVLDRADTSAALGDAAAARESLERELDEGDTPQAAFDEVGDTAGAAGMRVTVVRPFALSRGAPLPPIPGGTCTTLVETRGTSWRACASEGPRAAVVAAVPIGDHRAAVGSLARGMLAVVVIALLALWGATLRTVRASLRELMALVGWTTTIVDTEQAATPPETRTQEIAQLQAAFDAMVRRLLDALARERASSAHIAHELRTPLTAMMAELDSLKVPDGAARTAVGRVRSDAARLADVIEAILVLSTRAGSAQDTLPIVNVADVARSLAPEGTRVVAPDEALVEGDERLIALALRNLFDNARKYAAGVEVVNVSRAGDKVRLAVVDRGPGLEDAARARMFDRYWRGSADGDGKGLGLALVRAVAERHGGGAEARPGPHGKGLDVSLTLGRLVAWHEEAAAAPLSTG